MLHPGGVPGGDLPGRLLLRAVRILLECILVILPITDITLKNQTTVHCNKGLLMESGKIIILWEQI